MHRNLSEVRVSAFIWLQNLFVFDRNIELAINKRFNNMMVVGMQIAFRTRTARVDSHSNALSNQL